METQRRPYTDDQQEFDGMTPANDALMEILRTARALTDTETCPLLQAHGRILAASQLSPLDVPPADNSAMDGYAIRHADLRPDTTQQLFVISQRIPAGTVPAALKPGTAARIFTGAEIPAGADTVIMQEHCVETNGHATESTVSIPTDSSLGNNIRPQGQDIRRGAEVAAAGQVLTPQTLALLASIGIAQAPVFRRLKVAILSTGDELAEPGQPLRPGQIYNSNRFLLAGLLEKMGITYVDLGRVADTPQATLQALSRATLEADVIISSGGVSVGEEDHIKAAVEKLGELNLWKVAIKPGKPLAFGRVGDTPFFGLPGNPVSTFLTFLLFARPFLQKMQGREPLLPQGSWVPARFTRAKKSIREEFVRVRINNDGTMEAHPNQSSGVLSSTSWSNGIAIVPINTVIAAGDPVRVISYEQFF
jgi:molybdopterin molybdotransferase